MQKGTEKETAKSEAENSLTAYRLFGIMISYIGDQKTLKLRREWS